MRIAITGASGFIGGALCNFFASHGWQVYAIASPNSPIGFLSSQQAVHIRLPSAELETILEEFKPSLLIHAAGSASVMQSLTSPMKDFLSGPPVVFSVLEAVRNKSPDTRCIFLSSAAVYGNPSELPITEDKELAPISPYGFHKLQSESLVKEFSVIYGLQAVNLRLFSIYGSGLRKQFFWDFCTKASRSNNVLLEGTGEECRDFMHIQDLCRAIDIVNQKGEYDGRSINICSGNSYSIKEISSLLTEVTPGLRSIEFSGKVTQGVPSRWEAKSTFLDDCKFECRTSISQGAKDYVHWFFNQSKTGKN
jgi:UDP-glucose 4-epimerase